ncbi:DUF6011 domain-containing protein [Streptomyces sp. DH12]|uniref:DUF6011 domain-containing protein n=1 Tax=Streptomyces sp. DH12 TaxID=2857010 RepID=UPI001E3AC67B|nr:DUF6011 domain-containing protein [Streptomyces sp. DH12]
MARPEQHVLADLPPTPRARVRCRKCRRELTDPESRRRRLGPECDPDARITHDRHHVDQEPIPGL